MIYIKVEDRYILLDGDLNIDNINNDDLKEEIINSVMDRLELEKDIILNKRINKGVKVKKLGIYPHLSR